MAGRIRRQLVRTAEAALSLAITRMLVPAVVPELALTAQEVLTYSLLCISELSESANFVHNTYHHWASERRGGQVKQPQPCTGAYSA